MHANIVAEFCTVLLGCAFILVCFEIYEKVLYFSKGVDDLEGNLIRLRIVGGNCKFLRLRCPSFMPLSLPFKKDPCQRFLIFEIDHIPRVYFKRPIQSVQLYPNLLLQHEGSLLCSGKQNLIGVEIEHIHLVLNRISHQLWLRISNGYPAICEDYLKDIEFAILARVEKYLNFLERSCQLLCRIVKQFLVVLLDENDPRGLILEFMQLRPVDPALHLVFTGLTLPHFEDETLGIEFKLVVDLYFGLVGGLH